MLVCDFKCITILEYVVEIILLQVSCSCYTLYFSQFFFFLAITTTAADAAVDVVVIPLVAVVVVK